ncbi:MAG: RNA methyltransferase [Acidimicrobiaceae bacterium]|nr:RNA methyltransferase [Acidimicrobiaceae bacterium]
MGRRRASDHPCLVVCPPGLEARVAEELVALGARPERTGRGGVSVGLTTRRLYAANLFQRCATRILVRADRFTVRTFADLERRIAAIDWSPWLPADAAPRFRVTTRHSKLWHGGAVAERFAAAFPETGGKGFEEGGMGDVAHPLVVVRGVDDRFTVSVDSSGAPLHERGWRQATAKAPLRESVAAGLLASAGWDPSAPLVDPMCGSGTIAIEAALLAAGVPAAADRHLALWDWPSFEPGTWASVGADAARLRETAAVPDGSGMPRIVATDRDAGAIEAARANAERAGVADRIEFRVAPVAVLEPPPGAGGGEPAGLVATNPPWGGRVGGGDLRNLYATLGRVAAERFPGWGIGVLVADRDLARQVRLGLDERLHLDLGGRSAHWLVGRLPA